MAYEYEVGGDYSPGGVPWVPAEPVTPAVTPASLTPAYDYAAESAARSAALDIPSTPPAPVPSVENLFSGQYSGLQPSGIGSGNGYTNFTFSKDAFPGLALEPGKSLKADLLFDPRTTTYGISQPTVTQDRPMTDSVTGKPLLNADGTPAMIKGSQGSATLTLSADGKSVVVRTDSPQLLDTIKAGGGLDPRSLSIPESQLTFTSGSLTGKTGAPLSSFDDLASAPTGTGYRVVTIPGAAGKVTASHVVPSLAADGSVTLQAATEKTPGAVPWNSAAGSYITRDNSDESWGKKDWLAIAPSLVSLVTLAATYVMGQQQLDAQKKMARESQEMQLKMLGLQYGAASSGDGDGNGGGGLKIQRLLT